MADITIEQIKDLRERTGAGVSAVKDALEQAQGDTDKAIQILREKGVAKAAKRADREAKNGIVGVYVHHDSRMAVLVQVAAETDFAAKSPDMKKFADDIALHIAAMQTEYLRVEDIPAEVVEAEKAVYAKGTEGKPAEIVEKMLSGRLEKFYEENVLTHQRLFSDDSKTVQDYMNELVAKIGEKIEVVKFVKMQIAQPTSSCGL